VSCHTCLDGACDPEFHASSKRIRAWMIRRIDLATPPLPAKPRTFAPRVADVVNLGLSTIEARRRASRLGGRGGRK
jgi:hypothetical protein